MAEEKKSIFKKIGEAFSTKDEKAAVEAAQTVSQDAAKAAAKAKMEAEKAQAELAEMKKKQELEEARERIEAARKAAAKVEADKVMAAAAAAEALKPKYTIIKEHTLTPDDTLSGLALHFYGHATPPYWQFIIEVNKDTIGSEVKDYTPGKVIKIAELPEELKDK